MLTKRLISDARTGQQSIEEYDDPRALTLEQAEAAEQTTLAEAAAVQQDQGRFRQDFATAMQWLSDGISAMQTIEGQTFANNAQRDAAIKRNARGVRECSMILRRMLRLEARRLG